ncbi:MAG: DegT/DnrJ/EryC1/StrS aminotransferase family protein [bacterium]
MRQIPFGKPIIGEEEKQAVAEVLGGPMLVHGPKMKHFEEDFAAYTGAEHAVATSSCTTAMHLFYLAVGLGPGDEVIVPAQTHITTVHTVEFCGAKPVFVDAEYATGNIDIDQIEDKITERTRAIALVHFLGMPVDMGRINHIAKKHELLVLEDCALAIGAYFKSVHAGLHGDAGCFSFYPVKHITTAEGGMLITRNGETAAKAERLRAFGLDRTVGERKIPGVYDVDMLGYNFRMNEIQAAIGIEQLKRLDGFLQKRKENYEALQKGLLEIDEIELLESDVEGFTCNHYCLSAILKKDIALKRFEIVEHLKRNGVGTSVYYPRPVPHMTYYREKYGFDENSFPGASRISYRSIALPVGPHLNGEDMEYIIDTMKKALSEVAKQQ